MSEKEWWEFHLLIFIYSIDKGVYSFHSTAENIFKFHTACGGPSDVYVIIHDESSETNKNQL
jgi:hypothetical protein